MRDLFLNNWFSAGNELNTDFELNSSYNDLVNKPTLLYFTPSIPWIIGFDVSIDSIHLFMIVYQTLRLCVNQWERGGNEKILR